MKKIYIFVVAVAICISVGAQSIHAQTSSATFTQTLRYGSTHSAEVTKLQDFLIAKGYLVGAPNGMIYQTTFDAIKNFQKANNLTADGIVGFNTRAVLNRLYTAWKTTAGTSGSALCTSPEVQELIDETWPQPCNGGNQCGVRHTGASPIKTNACYIWAVLPTFDDSVTSILHSALIDTATMSISYTYPEVHTCRSSQVWTSEICP